MADPGPKHIPDPEQTLILTNEETRMQSSRSSLIAPLAVLCAMLFATFGNAAEAAVATASTAAATRVANGVRVTTGLMALPVNHTARVAIIQATANPTRLPVLVRFKDANGNVLGSSNGVLAMNQPVIAAVQRGTVVSTAPVLVQAEVVLGPVPGGLGLTTCPAHFSIQTTTGDEDGTLQGCVIDTCLNVSPGTSPRQSVSAICHIQKVLLNP